MSRFKKWAILIVSVALVAAAGLGALAFSNVLSVKAATGISAGDRGGFGFPGGPDLPGFGYDHQQYLADALGITLEELQAAELKARQAELAQAVEDGLITQEQADLMIARQQLSGYVDQQAIMAEALGLSVDELQAALEDGKSLRDLMEEKGLDAAALHEAQQAAYEKAIQAAVSDGVITQEQADQILSAGGDFGFPRGFGLPGDGFGRGGRHGDFFGGPGRGWKVNPETTPSTPSGDASGTGL